MDTTTWNEQDSAQDVFSQLGIVEEVSYDPIDSFPPLDEPMNHTTEKQSFLEVESSKYLSKYCERTFDDLESIINEFVAPPKDLVSVNYENLDLHCEQYSPSPSACSIISSSSDQASVSKHYHTLSPVFLQQDEDNLINSNVSNERIERVEPNDETNGPSIYTRNVTRPDLLVQISDDKQQKSKDIMLNDIIKHVVPETLSQRASFLLGENSNTKKDLANNCIYNLGTNVPLVLVPLSLLRSYSKLNNLFIVPPQSNFNPDDSPLKQTSRETHASMWESRLPQPIPDTETTLSEVTSTQERPQRRAQSKECTRMTKTMKSNSSKPKLNLLKNQINIDERKTTLVQKHIELKRNKFMKSQLDDFVFCKVCGDEATKHTHYGGRSCSSCRAFFRRSVERFTRHASLRYYCKCAEGCFEKQETVCMISKLTRNRCKYCRYTRCENSAGMVKEWVVSAYIPTVKRMSKGAKSRNSKDIREENKELPPKTKHVKDIKLTDPIINHRSMTCVSDKKVINEFRNVVKSNKGENISKEMQERLENMVNQQVSLFAIEFPEFANLEFSIRVIILKKNFTSLLRLGVVKFMYDNILTEDSTCSKVTALHRVLYTNYWTEKSSLQSPISETQIKRILRKIVELIDGDRNIFGFLFPIMLFDTTGATDVDETVFEHQLRHMQLLEEFLLIQLKGDRELAAVRLGMANELSYYLQQF